MGNAPAFRFLHSYVHNGRVGVLVELGCESDFLTHTEGFVALIKDVALQIAATAPADLDALLGQRFVKDESRCIADILGEASAKYHERISITRFIRWATEDEGGTDSPPAPRAPAVIMSFRRA